jgi:hypothetical protein
VASDVRRLVFTAGACPLDEDGATVAVRGVAGQAEQVMADLRTALAAAAVVTTRTRVGDGDATLTVRSDAGADELGGSRKICTVEQPFWFRGPLIVVSAAYPQAPLSPHTPGEFR